MFYESIFIKKYSVCKAFELAKEDVKTLYTAAESSKYMLLVNEKMNSSQKGKKFKHKCFPIAKYNEGRLTKIGTQPVFNSIPSNVDKFRGRQQEICEVLSLLNENRLVNVLGPPGIGKTAISRNICNHLKDRNKFCDGIIYVSMRGCESAQMFLTRLSLAIQTSAKNSGIKLDVLQACPSFDSSSDKDGSMMNKEDERKMLYFMVNVLRDKEALIVLDN